MNTPFDSTQDDRPIRAFMAAVISESVRSNLVEIQASLKQTGAAVGWVAPANIHLTLLFLGPVFKSQAAALAAATDTLTAGFHPCTLEVKGIGTFGRPSSPRIIWAGVTGDLRPLLALQAAMAAAAKQIGIFPDDKPFHPHLTLGRVRSSRRAQELLHAIEPYRDMILGPLEIQSVELMKSDLMPQGPIYTTLHESRLSANSGPVPT